MTPTIYVYEAIGEAPAHMRFAASLSRTGPGTHWTTAGATAEEARQKLLTFWEMNEAPGAAQRRIDARKAKKASEPVVPSGYDLDVVL